MPTLNLERLRAHRTRTFHLFAATRIQSPPQALDFVNERGFIFFWPVKGVDLPSLWEAVGGSYPVSSDHDDPFHVTWRWKDDALDKRIWYYGKILRRKATFISLEVAPYFYALSENYGSLEEDYLVAYQAGRLTQAAKKIYEALLDNGALDTISLRKSARLANAKESEFNRAMEDLQKDFKILPVGIAEAGAWRYAYRYDITARHMPELPEKARSIGEAEARQKLVEMYFASVGAATVRDVSKLFGWPLELAARAVNRLVEDDVLVEADHPQNPGHWLALLELVT
ncbi:MAG: winged helix DNA-binding domain-containing protein [Chloroflexi bacterium]|nr:winged helix DNA-binding domain-containing protein [Chloroflexota bacterium]